MKKCPFCAEEIQDEAIKCRYCGEYLNTAYIPVPKPTPKPKTKWYFSTSAVVIGLLCVGPLALPLVWINPKYKIITKAVITGVVILATLWLYRLMGDMYKELMSQINSLGLR